MGQYFRFHNETEDIYNQKPIKANGGLTWYPKLNYLDPNKQKNIFNEVIENNNWSRKSIIVAYGDNGSVIYYNPETDEIYQIS